MPLWTMTDNENGKPKYLNTTDKENTFGVDTDEMLVSNEEGKGVSHAGWVLKHTKTRGGVTQTWYETMVAASSMTDDAEDVVYPDAVITIATQPTALSIEDGSSGATSVVATVQPTSKTIVYQWSTSGTVDGSYTDINDVSGLYSGSATEELTINTSVDNSIDQDFYKCTLTVADSGETVETTPIQLTITSPTP